MPDIDVLADMPDTPGFAHLQSDLKTILESPEGCRVIMWWLSDLGLGLPAISTDQSQIALYNFALSRLAIMRDIAPMQTAGMLAQLYGLNL